MYVDVGQTASGTATNWVAESGVLDLFFMLGPQPAQVELRVLCATQCVRLHFKTLGLRWPLSCAGL